MTKISAFRGLAYNQDKITDLSKVVCPPYDIISSQDRERYYANHLHNLIRLILGKDEPGDNKRENKYTRAAALFDKWIKERILKQDDKEAIYFYLQQYILKGERKERLGFIALMRLEDKGNSIVFGHEHTHLEPREDRFRLLKKVKANLSPIFTIFADEKKHINRIYNEYLKDRPPSASFADKDKVVHRLWRLTDKEIIGKLKKYMQARHIFIADGHHRYEVALLYRSQICKKRRDFNREASYNYVMTYFADVDSRGLSILPIHRVVKNMPGSCQDLLSLFDIEKIKTKQDLFLLLAKASLAEHAFGLYQSGNFYLLRLKNERSIDRIIKDGSCDYRKLDVVILHKVILGHLLNVRDEEVVFVKDEDEAVAMVEAGSAEAVFFLSPTKIEQIRAIALNDERMPPKSTFFYPKLMSGLVIHKF